MQISGSPINSHVHRTTVNSTECYFEKDLLLSLKCRLIPITAPRLAI